MQSISAFPSFFTLSRRQFFLAGRDLPRRTFFQTRLPNSVPRPRYFTNTVLLSKKKDKSKASPAPEPEPKGSKNAATSDDPEDLSVVQNGIANAVSRLKDDLSKLRAGGRFNTGAFESLRVHLKEPKETVKLGELAQVVPRGGRMTTVLVSEEDVSRSMLPTDLFCLSY